MPSPRSLSCVQMPVLSGMATIQLLRQMQSNREIIGHIPILACTANARDEQIRAMEAAGFDGIVGLVKMEVMRYFSIDEDLIRFRSLFGYRR